MSRSTRRASKAQKATRSNGSGMCIWSPTHPMDMRNCAEIVERGVCVLSVGYRWAAVDRAPSPAGLPGALTGPLVDPSSDLGGGRGGNEAGALEDIRDGDFKSSILSVTVFAKSVFRALSPMVNSYLTFRHVESESAVRPFPDAW